MGVLVGVEVSVKGGKSRANGRRAAEDPEIVDERAASLSGERQRSGDALAGWRGNRE
jgi:hypothetical protein